jgi:F-type H+-transporting ATPase subunit delta
VGAALDSALADGADGAAVGSGLFSTADVLRETAALRRAATDPTVPGQAKAALARELFGDHLEPAGTEVVATAFARRWAAAHDLADALAHVAVVSLVRAADQDGDGDQLEEDLFGFSRILGEHPELRDTLSDPGRSVSDKQDLVLSILEGKVTPCALELCRRTVTTTHLTVTSALEDFIEIASTTRGRLVARVWSARPLSEAHGEQMAAGLGRLYGRQVHLNVIIEPEVLGGVRIEIGDDVIDGTVAGRLDDARRLLVG